MYNDAQFNKNNAKLSFIKTGNYDRNSNKQIWISLKGTLMCALKSVSSFIQFQPFAFYIISNNNFQPRVEHNCICNWGKNNLLQGVSISSYRSRPRPVDTQYPRGWKAQHCTHPSPLSDASARVLSPWNWSFVRISRENPLRMTFCFHSFWKSCNAVLQNGIWIMWNTFEFYFYLSLILNHFCILSTFSF